MTPHLANVDAVFRDATAGIRVVAPLDFPTGLVAINERIGGRSMACAIGDGVELAAQYRHRGAAFLYDGTRYTGYHGVELLAYVHSISCHEVAHLLTTPRYDATAVAKRLDTLADRPAGFCDADTAARLHPPAWAAAFQILGSRLTAYRRYGRELARHVAECLSRHGYEPDAVARVVAGHDDTKSLRALLAPGGAAAALLELALPPQADRAARIVAAGTYPAAMTPTGAA